MSACRHLHDHSAFRAPTMTIKVQGGNGGFLWTYAIVEKRLSNGKTLYFHIGLAARDHNEKPLDYTTCRPQTNNYKFSNNGDVVADGYALTDEEANEKVWFQIDIVDCGEHLKSLFDACTQPVHNYNLKL